MSDRVSTLLEGRTERLEKILGRSLEPPRGTDDPPLTEAKKAYLLDEAQDLYWNELEWENLTEEEHLGEDVPLTELAFPGLLAFVRGLLLEEAMPDAQAPASPRPEVVDEILRFLAGRLVELQDDLDDASGEEAEQMETELAMTDRLIDLVLFELYDLSETELERIDEAGRPPG